jgi:hypothetical protein
LTGRCDRRLIAPLSGPIKDQDLRVVAPVLRLSDPAAATQVAVAVLHVLIRVGQLLHAADDVSAREIPLGVTEIFPRQAEVLSGGTEATMVVAVAMATMVAMMAMMAMVVVVVVLVIEQVLQETSDERCCQETEHAYSPFPLGVPAPASCRRPGACRWGY